jgi:hypothetical protein
MSLFIPVDVQAYVVEAGQSSAMTGATGPFGSSTLLAGVHLHWAMPDRLTTGSQTERGGQPAWAYLSLPDFWLVVRCSADGVLRPAPGGPSRRVVKAWLVDAYERTSVDVSASAPASVFQGPSSARTRRLTAVGLLDDGILTSAKIETLLAKTAPPDPDPLTLFPESDPISALALRAAYYPSCVGPRIAPQQRELDGGRFGLHDPASDAAGPLSYYVLGWYSHVLEDPYYTSSDKAEFAKGRWAVPLGKTGDVSTDVAVAAVPLANALQSKGVQVMQARAQQPTPDAIVCQGAVVDVKWKGVGGQHARPGASVGKVTVAISVTAARAAVVAFVGNDAPAASEADEHEVEVMEAATLGLTRPMAGGVEYATRAGTIVTALNESAMRVAEGLPFELHTRSFASAQGEATDEWHATIDPALGFGSPSWSQVNLAGLARVWVRDVRARVAGGEQRFLGARKQQGSRYPLDGASLAAWCRSLSSGYGRTAQHVQRPGPPGILEKRASFGPSWHRPRPIGLALVGAGRSLRHGYDGRLSEDDELACRRASIVSIGFTAAGNPGTTASKYIQNELLPTVLPLPVRHAMEELALFDPSSHGAGSPGRRVSLFPHALALDATLADAVSGVDVTALPHALGITLWSQPDQVLFADVQYDLHPAAGTAEGAIATSWTLAEHADMGPRNDVAFDTVVSATERCTLIGASPRLWQSAADEAAGVAVLAPTGDRVADLDVLTASLGVDRILASQGYLVRGGCVTLKKLNLVGIFGETRTLTPGGSAMAVVRDGMSSVSGPAQAHALMNPRIIGHGRCMARWTRAKWIAAAANEQPVAADPAQPPILGFVAPDFVDGALELFDENGRSLGQIAESGIDELVKREEWPSALGMLAGSLGEDSAARDAFLHAFEQAQVMTNVANPKVHDVRALVGRPLALVRMHIWVETAASIAHGHEADPLSVTGISAVIGDVFQSDDGLLGYVLPGEVHAGRFKALYAVDSLLLKQDQIHDSAFIRPPTPVPLSRKPVEVILLMDPYAAVYVTTGLLPRKRLVLPQDLCDEVTRRVRPTVRVRSILFDPKAPTLPTPVLPGHSWEWIERGKDGPLLPVTLADEPPTSAIPRAGSARITTGWLRPVVRPEKAP